MVRTRRAIRAATVCPMRRLRLWWLGCGKSPAAIERAVTMGRSLATVVLCLGAWSVASSSEPAPAPPPDAAASAVRSPADMPFWAYGITTRPQPGDTARELPWGRLFDPDVDHAQQLRPTLHLAGSPRTYAPVELRDWANAPDWFPDEHPPMPEVVQHGVAALGEKRRACAICHRVNGGGRPDNAPVAGLPVDYFLRQLDDFRRGRRHSSDPRKPNVRIMQEIAQAITPDEAREAAEYYAGRSGAPRLHVVESDRAPPVSPPPNGVPAEPKTASARSPVRRSRHGCGRKQSRAARQALRALRKLPSRLRSQNHGGHLRGLRVGRLCVSARGPGCVRTALSMLHRPALASFSRRFSIHSGPRSLGGVY